MPSPWPGIRLGQRISAAADSADCMSLAKTWIAECLSNHLECLSIHGKYEPTSLPDRVLCIRSEQSTFLFVNSEGRVARYAALSHRWGDFAPLQLSKATLNSWQRGISPFSLPPMFQDTVRVCRALWIEYLWIDSLCIVQDSTEDWNEQASRMSQIYSCAYVTIAADAASSYGIGFLEGNREQVSREMREHPMWGDENGRCPTPHPSDWLAPAPVDGERMSESWECVNPTLS